MSPAIVDTDVVSFLFKRDSRAEAYEQHLTGRLLGISFMTLAELERWSLERNWGIVRMQQFAVFLRKFAVLPANRELCRKWAEIAAARSRCGHPIQTADAWIAATALLYNVPLITHNRSDFDRIDGLEVITC